MDLPVSILRAASELRLMRLRVQGQTRPGKKPQKPSVAGTNVRLWDGPQTTFS